MVNEYDKMDPRQLARRRMELQQEMGQLEQELNLRRTQDRHLTRSSDLKWRLSGEDLKMDTQRHPLRTASAVGPELGFNVHNFYSFFAEVPAGAQAGAYHMHGEAVKYYIQGKGVEIIGDKRYEVQAGDVVFVPANTWHGTQNPYQEPLRFFAVAQGGNPSLVLPICKSREDLRTSPV